jgi:non-ribosomal peptide synthetase component F
MTGAYVFFTSGSTGVPKGVLVGDGGLDALWETQTKAFGMDETSVSTWMLSPAFDASVSDVGCALWCGSTLLVVPAGRWKRPRTFLEDVTQYGVTHMDAPPALLALWARKSQTLFSGGIPPTLKTLIVGGEVSPPDSVDFWTRHLRWVNVYGPTETTVCSSLEVLDGNTGTHIPTLGDPLPGIAYRVLEAGSTCPDGPEVTDGELWIGGEAVALGYLQQPDLSAERFFEDQGRRWFKTGDRVEKTTTGGRDVWVYKGRMDRQVKRHGQLLHLDEVEQVLQAVPGVVCGVVVVDSHDHLVGLLSDGVDETVLMTHLQSRLPAWGVPRHWFVAPDWSLTQSGKPDRTALLAQWEAR